MKRFARILVLIGSVLLLLSCSREQSVTPTTEATGLDKDRQFIQGMVDLHPKSELTGLAMLELAYSYCTSLVEGSTLQELYARITLLEDDEQILHGSIVDMAINTICQID